MTESSAARALRTAYLASAAPLALYLMLRFLPDVDARLHLPVFHLLVGCALAVVAVVAGTALALSGARLRNLQLSLLALSYLSLGLLQAVHSLATPDVFTGHTHVLPAAAQLSLLLAAFWLYLSSLPSTHPLVRPLASLESALPLGVGFTLAGFGVWSLLNPELLRWVPVDDTLALGVVATVTLLLVLGSVRHHARSYRYARFPLQLAAVYGGLWLAGAQLVLVTSELWNASWWIYHFLLHAGVFAGVVGLARQYALDRRGRAAGATLADAVQGLWTRDADALLAMGISPSVRDLVRTLEAHDPYTAGHSYRVAREAVRLGRAAGCTPEELRALAQGGILHDLGKLDVHADLLNKPERLTAEERAEVEAHPERGYDLCRHLGFLPAELAVIRHHHERWDGTGYPHRRQGRDIPRLARILAIADVYDALTSERAYRTAWPDARARAFILAEAGRHFDPDLVTVWLALPRDTEELAVPRRPAGAPLVPST